jgi:uncharacterized repeat protein (TIGR03803 family)
MVESLLTLFTLGVTCLLLKRRTIMTTPKLHWGWVARLTLGAANTALVLAVMVAPLIFASRSAQAQLTALYTFTGGTDGGRPEARVISDTSGNLYGTTLWGGNLTCNFGFGCGVVYKLTPTGTETVLYSFAGGTDGAYPSAALFRDANGNLWGTTTAGGGTGCFGNGCGTVFRVGTTGTYKVVYHFTNGTDGGVPNSALIQDALGRFVGTASSGGDPSCACGVVYAIDRTGKEVVLMSFPGGASGAYPLDDNLAKDASGNFYGSTASGGDPTCYCGVVYKLDPTGTETVLYTFLGGTDGQSPSGVTRDSKGNLYGTTILGGVNGKGTLFEITSSGSYTKLHDFGGPSDGATPPDAATPSGGVTFCSDGSLFGTAEAGGSLGFGAAWRMALTGLRKESVIANFDYSFSGGVPVADINEDFDDDGAVLHGTASEGGNVNGASGSGTVTAMDYDRLGRTVSCHH